MAAGHDSLKDHINFLKLHFEATKKYNLKFTKNKCRFAVQEVKILGKILDEKGERPDPERARAVSRYTSLNSLFEVSSFLEFANTLRKYIKNFAHIAKPLTDKLKKTDSRAKYKTKNVPIFLNEDEFQCFIKLKTALTSAPILAH